MLFALLLIVITVAGSNMLGKSNIRATNAAVISTDTKPLDDPPGTINGAINPELVPDRIAYTLLFRLISNRQTDEEKGRIRAYTCRGGLGMGL